MRLNKYLADCGVGSRRACDKLIDICLCAQALGGYKGLRQYLPRPRRGYGQIGQCFDVRSRSAVVYLFGVNI